MHAAVPRGCARAQNTLKTLNKQPPNTERHQSRCPQVSRPVKMSYALAKQFGPLHKPYGEWPAQPCGVRSHWLRKQRHPRLRPGRYSAPQVSSRPPFLRRAPHSLPTPFPPAVPANSDAEGYPDMRLGLKHVAVRSDGRESTYKPSTANVAPRPQTWAPVPSPEPKPRLNQ